MGYISIIDSSVFIWNISDFTENELEYYELISSLPNLYMSLISNKSYVLLREELKNQIILEYPYSVTDIMFYDFQILSLNFLNNLGEKMIVFPARDQSDLQSIPDLEKQHFSLETNQEIRYLITYLYSKKNSGSTFFTCKYFWGNQENLTISGRKSIEIETIQFDDDSALSEFFNRNKKFFDHNPKHNKYKSGGDISLLSCYNERKGDKTKAQRLLDEAYDIDGTLYNFDIENKVYVTFVHTNENIYHGYDEHDIAAIPNEIRKKFHK